MLSPLTIFLLDKTNVLYVAEGLYSNRSQMIPKCVKTSVTHSAAHPEPFFLFQSHSDVICDPVLISCTAALNMFVINDPLPEFHVAR